MKRYTDIPRAQQLSSTRERAASDLCKAAKDTGVGLAKLDQKTYRRWWLRRPSSCHMPTDICLLFGSWDEAKEQAAASFGTKEAAA